MSKRCSRCRTEKPPGEFHKDARAPDGLSYYCRPCNNAQRRGEPRPQWPVPMEDEPTAPGIPPPSLKDPSKPDVAAYSQKPRFKLLHIDIETTPLVALAWRTHKENISPEQILEPTRVLCFAATWHGSGEMIYYEARRKDSLEYNTMIRAAHSLLSASDAVCTYNGIRFDAPRLDREFLLLGLPPTKPLKHIDLWQTVTQFGMDSSKLAFVGPQLGTGEKVKHEGWGLWRRCMEGDPTAFAEMQVYCKGDVAQMPALYEKLRPWIKGHPNMNLYAPDEGPVCTRCGSDRREITDPHVAITSVYKQWRCLDCGGVYRDRGRDKAEPVASVR